MISLNRIDFTNDENQVSFSVELGFSKDGAAHTSKFQRARSRWVKVRPDQRL